MIDILEADRFTKKKLTLIFRLSLPENKTSNLNSALESSSNMYNKGNLIFLIRTKSNRLIGGYTQSKIIPNKEDIEDDMAYIFSVTAGKKFYKKKEEK